MHEHKSALLKIYIVNMIIHHGTEQSQPAGEQTDRKVALLFS